MRGFLFAAFKSLADYRTKAINHLTQLYRIKTAKYMCMMFCDSWGSFNYPRVLYFIAHIFSM